MNSKISISLEEVSIARRVPSESVYRHFARRLPSKRVMGRIALSAARARSPAPAPELTGTDPAHPPVGPTLGRMEGGTASTPLMFFASATLEGLDAVY